MAYESQEAYLEALPDDAKARLLAIQALVLSRFPDATKCISYNMPAFKAGRVFIYFAAFKHHVGIYPPVTRDAALIQALAPFRGPKGNLSFPLGSPLPLALVERVILALHKEYAH